MKIEFVGGARTVTGSSYIVKNENFTIMIDCGMFQGKKRLRDRNFLSLIYAPEEIDAVLLTHAHIDHSGLIPKLLKRGFTKSIYATKATVDLCSIMLPDSAHIQEMDTEWINRKRKKLGLEPIEPLYTTDHAEAALKSFVPVNYGEIVDIIPGVKARFRDDGHILGSAFIELWVEDQGKTKKIIFSGDIGSKDQALIRNHEYPEEADILLIETTYGDRLHKNRKDTYQEFKNIIHDSYNKKGNIVIPSFAVERTQEIIYTLGQLFKSGEIPRIKVFIDSPLAISATEVFKRNPECLDEETNKLLMSGDNPLDYPNLHYAKSSEESKRIIEEEKGAIILSASGMCTAGRIKYHLQNNLYKPESSIIFVGYQAEGTLGRRLVDGAPKVRVYGEDISVKAKIYTLGGFSAHADRDGLLNWMSKIDNKNLIVFAVHGEEKVSLNFAESVKNKYGYKTYVPKWGEILDPETLQSDYAEYGKDMVPEADIEISQMISGLKDSMKKMLTKYEQAKKMNNIDDLEKMEDDIRELKEMIDSIAD